MPKYQTNAYLLHEGKVVPKNREIDLTEEQAKRLGDKVKPVENNKNKTVAELKEEAKIAGIDGYNDMKKDELLEALYE